MKEFYITAKAGNYIEDIDESINTTLEEIKNCYQHKKLRLSNIRSQLSVSTRREPRKKLKLLKYSSTLTILLITQYMKVDSTQWLNFEKKVYEGYGYDFEFFGLRSIQINNEPTKASIGSYTCLPTPISKTLNQF